MSNVLLNSSILAIYMAFENQAKLVKFIVDKSLAVRIILSVLSLALRLSLYL
jgi:hypothetical protein